MEDNQTNLELRAPERERGPESTAAGHALPAHPGMGRPAPLLLPEKYLPPHLSPSWRRRQIEVAAHGWPTYGIVAALQQPEAGLFLMAASGELRKSEGAMVDKERRWRRSWL
jgi:hypothetical protein